jgi:phosphomannomutase
MSIFKAYDIRGVYGKEINEELAYSISKAYVDLLKPKTVVVGRDGRISGPSLSLSIIKGIVEQGCDVIDIGLSSTDMFYFAVYHLKADGGLMITASHNSKEYNGVKLVREKAIPINEDSGIKDVERLVALRNFSVSKKKGKAIKKNILPEFVQTLRSYADLSKIKGLKVVMDAANGMGGMIASELFKGVDIKIIPLYFEVDGNFPNHGPNPLLEENHREMLKRVVKEKADLGVMWDGDCDRVFFVDEKGEFVKGDFITGLLAETMLKKNSGRMVIYDLRASKYVPDTILKNKGKPFESRVGHSFIKQRMRDYDGVFGGEITGHYYYKIEDDLYSDNGFIPVIQILEMLCTHKVKMSELLKASANYHKSDEINSEVRDKDKKMKEIEEAYKKKAKRISHLDGITIELDNFWFNIRPSNTENLLRLNLEATSDKLLKEKIKEVLGLIRC